MPRWISLLLPPYHYNKRIMLGTLWFFFLPLFKGVKFILEGFYVHPYQLEMATTKMFPWGRFSFNWRRTAEST